MGLSVVVAMRLRCNAQECVITTSSNCRATLPLFVKKGLYVCIWSFLTLKTRNISPIHHPFFHPPIHPFNHLSNLSAHPSTDHYSNYPFVHPPRHPSNHQPDHPPTHDGATPTLSCQSAIIFILVPLWTLSSSLHRSYGTGIKSADYSQTLNQL